MPTSSRRSPSPSAFGSLSLAIALCCMAFVAPAVSADEAAPLQLGSEHLGMTSEGITDVEQHADTERRVDEAIEKSEWSDADLTSDTEAELIDVDTSECIAPALAPVATGPTPIEVTAIGVSDYGSCVEVAIRSGNGFKAASGVCQALFPEVAVDADATDEAGPDAAVQSAPEADDDLSASPTGY